VARAAYGRKIGLNDLLPRRTWESGLPAPYAIKVRRNRASPRRGKPQIRLSLWLIRKGNPRSETRGALADALPDGFSQSDNLIGLAANPGPVLFLEIEAGVSIGEIPLRQLYDARWR
jgi:hypothetical protein